MNRNILRCPYCYMQGDIQSLGEVMPDGAINITRRKKMTDYGEDLEVTLIRGKEFEIICGKCKNIAYFKTPVIPIGTITFAEIQLNTKLYYGSI